MLTSFYWDNLIHFGMAPKRGPDGRLVFTLPMGERRLPGIAAEDIGRSAYGIFREGAEDLGSMFQFKHDFEDYCCGARDPAAARALNLSLLTSRPWPTHWKNRIPLG